MRFFLQLVAARFSLILKTQNSKKIRFEKNREILVGGGVGLGGEGLEISRVTLTPPPPLIWSLEYVFLILTDQNKIL